MDMVIGTWATRLAFLILFATLMEVSLPNGELRRYVKTLLGLVVLVAMLHPIIAVLKGDTYIDVLLGPGLDSPWADTAVKSGIAVGEAAIGAVADVVTRDVAQAVELELGELAGLDAVQVRITGASAQVYVQGAYTSQLANQVQNVVAQHLQVAADEVAVQWVTGHF